MRNTAGAAAMSLYAFRLQQLATDAVVLGVRVGSRREPLSASPFDNGGVSTAETERAQSRTMARTGPRGGGGGGLRGRLPNSTRLDLSAPSLSAALAQSSHSSLEHRMGATAAFPSPPARPFPRPSSTIAAESEAGSRGRRSGVPQGSEGRYSASQSEERGVVAGAARGGASAGAGLRRASSGTGAVAWPEGPGMGWVEVGDAWGLPRRVGGPLDEAMQAIEEQDERGAGERTSNARPSMHAPPLPLPASPSAKGLPSPTTPLARAVTSAEEAPGARGNRTLREASSRAVAVEVTVPDTAPRAARGAAVAVSVAAARGQGVNGHALPASSLSFKGGMVMASLGSVDGSDTGAEGDEEGLGSTRGQGGTPGPDRRRTRSRFLSLGRREPRVAVGDEGAARMAPVVKIPSRRSRAVVVDEGAADWSASPLASPAERRAVAQGAPGPSSPPQRESGAQSGEGSEGLSAPGADAQAGARGVRSRAASLAQGTVPGSDSATRRGSGGTVGREEEVGKGARPRATKVLCDGVAVNVDVCGEGRGRRPGLVSRLSRKLLLLTTSAAPSQLSTQVLSTPSDGGNTLRRDDPRLAHPEASQPALGESRARTEGRHAPAEAHVSSTRNVRKVLTDSAADEGGRGRPAEGGWLAKVARTLSLRRQLSNAEAPPRRDSDAHSSQGAGRAAPAPGATSLVGTPEKGRPPRASRRSGSSVVRPESPRANGSGSSNHGAWRSGEVAVTAGVGPATRAPRRLFSRSKWASAGLQWGRTSHDSQRSRGPSEGEGAGKAGSEGRPSDRKVAEEGARGVGVPLAS